MKTDLQLQKDVMDQLTWEPKLHAAEIGVAAKNGIITLNGYVSNYEQKVAAEKKAMKVAGVKGLAQEIEVKPIGSNRKDDPEIATVIVNALKWNSSVPNDRIQVKVEDGWVTLNGEVEWWYQLNEAKKAVEALIGVRGVTNLINIKSNMSAENIRSKIQSAFARNASLESKSIKIEVNGSTITLSGYLPGWHEIEEAENAAWTIPGVTRVINRLSLEETVMIPEI